MIAKGKAPYPNTGYGCQETYDRYGNRLVQSNYNGGSCMTPSYSPSGNNDNRLYGYTYNGNGDLMNDGLHAYTYDAEDRVATVDGTAATFVYDASGRRVEKVSGGVAQDYVYDLGGHVVAETDSAGVWTRSELYAGGLHLATYDNGTTTFNHADWLGTERIRTTATGGVLANSAWTSYPFGEGSATPNPSPTHFTGKERDSESSLDYFGARYLNSRMGRFMSPDWGNNSQAVPYASLGNPQSLNLYSYVENNPLGSVDPDGHSPRPWWATSNTDLPPLSYEEEMPLGLQGGDTDAYNAYLGQVAAAKPQAQQRTANVTVIITYDYGIGDHASLYVQNGNDWEIYDPDGSYAQKRNAGSGDIVTQDNDASRADWIQFEKDHSGSIKLFSFAVTPADAKRIQGNIEKDSDSHDNDRWLPCAHSVSTVISGVGPFEKVTPVFLRPAALASELKNIPHTSQ